MSEKVDDDDDGDFDNHLSMAHIVQQLEEEEDDGLDHFMDDDSEHDQNSIRPRSAGFLRKGMNNAGGPGAAAAVGDEDLFAVDFGLLDENGELPVVNEKDFITTSSEYQDCLEIIRQQRERLVRRTKIIDDIRKYYLRDVITVKHILREVLTDPERESVMKMYDARLPSLDLKAALQLHAPTKCEMQVRHCGECGGQLEIIMKDSDEVERLKKVIGDCRERESRFRMKLATLDAQVESTAREKAEAAKSHMEEKRFLYGEMKKLKDEHERLKLDIQKVTKMNKKVTAENEEFRSNNSDLFLAAQKLQDTEAEVVNLNNELAESQQLLKTLKAADKAAQKQLAARAVDSDELRARAEQQAEELRRERSEKTALQEKNQRMKNALSEAETKLTDTSAAVAQLVRQKSELQAQSELTESQQRSLISALESAVHQLQQSVAVHEKSEQLHKSERENLLNELELAGGKLQKMVAAKRALEEELAQNEAELRICEEEIDEMKKHIKAKLRAEAQQQQHGDADVAEAALLTAVKNLLGSIRRSAEDAVREELEAEAGEANSTAEDAALAAADAAQKKKAAKAAARKKRQQKDKDRADRFAQSTLSKRLAVKAAKRMKAGKKEYDVEFDDEDVVAIMNRVNRGKKKFLKEAKDEAAALKAVAEQAAVAATTVGDRSSGTYAAAWSEGYATGYSDGKSGNAFRANAPTGPAKRTPTPPLPRSVAATAAATTATVTNTAANTATTGRRGRSDATHVVGIATATDDSMQMDPPSDLASAATDLAANNNGNSERQSRSATRRSDRSSQSRSRSRSKSPTPSTAAAAVSRRSSDKRGSQKIAAPANGTKKRTAPSVEKLEVDTIAANEDDADDAEDVAAVAALEARKQQVQQRRQQAEAEKAAKQQQKEQQRAERQQQKAAKRELLRQQAAELRQSLNETDAAAADAAAAAAELEDDADDAAIDEDSDAVAAEAEAEEQEVRQLAAQIAERELQRKARKAAAAAAKLQRAEEHAQEKKLRQLEKEQLKKQAADEEDEEEEVFDDDSEEEEEEEQEETAAVAVERVQTKRRGKAEAKKKQQQQIESADSADSDHNDSDNNSQSDNNSESNNNSDIEDEEGSGILSRSDDGVDSFASADSSSIATGLLPPTAAAAASTDVGEASDATDAAAGEEMPPDLGDFDLDADGAAAAGEVAVLPPKRRKSLPKEFQQRGFKLKESWLLQQNKKSFNTKERVKMHRQQFDAGKFRTAGAKDRERVLVPVIPIEVKRYVKFFQQKKLYVPQAVAEEDVALDPAPDNASPLELQWREMIYKKIKGYPSMTEASAHKAINALSRSLHQLFSMLTKTMNSTWSALVMSRKSMDFIAKFEAVIEGMESCAEEAELESGQQPQNTLEHVLAVKKQIVELTLPGNGGVDLSARWLADSDMSDEISCDLVPQPDPDTGYREIKSYRDFFLTDTEPQVLLDKINLSMETSRRLSDFSDDIHRKLNGSIKSVVKDWASLKEMSLNLQNMLQTERQQAVKPLENKLGGTVRELQKTSTSLEKALEKCRAQEQQLKDLRAVEGDLRATKQKLEARDFDVQNRNKKIEGLEREVKSLTAAHAEKTTEAVALSEEVASLSLQLQQTTAQLEERQSQLQQQQQQLGDVTEERDHFQQQFEVCLTREDVRMNQLVSADMQTEPEVDSKGVQTEFIVPPMSLRTMLTNKVHRGLANKHPMVLSQRLDLPLLQQQQQQRANNDNDFGVDVFPALSTALRRPQQQQQQTFASAATTAVASGVGGGGGSVDRSISNALPAGAAPLLSNHDNSNNNNNNNSVLSRQNSLRSQDSYLENIDEQLKNAVDAPQAIAYEPSQSQFSQQQQQSLTTGGLFDAFDDSHSRGGSAGSSGNSGGGSRQQQPRQQQQQQQRFMSASTSALPPHFGSSAAMFAATASAAAGDDFNGSSSSMDGDSSGFGHAFGSLRSSALRASAMRTGMEIMRGHRHKSNNNSNNKYNYNSSSNNQQQLSQSQQLQQRHPQFRLSVSPVPDEYRHVQSPAENNSLGVFDGSSQRKTRSTASTAAANAAAGASATLSSPCYTPASSSSGNSRAVNDLFVRHNAVAAAADNSPSLQHVDVRDGIVYNQRSAVPMRLQATAGKFKLADTSSSYNNNNISSSNSYGLSQQQQASLSIGNRQQQQFRGSEEGSAATAASEKARREMLLRLQRELMSR